MKNQLVAFVMLAALSGCATVTPSVPPGYTGAVATLRDSVQVESGRKAEFFFAKAIDGNEIANSRLSTLLANQGRGMGMTPEVIERPVPVRPLRVDLVARTEYAAPILAMTGTVYEVKGVVAFTPEADKTYVVRGTLGETYSAVWVEDEASGAVIGDKIEVRGSAKLGLFEK